MSAHHSSWYVAVSAFVEQAVDVVGGRVRLGTFLSRPANQIGLLLLLGAAVALLGVLRRALLNALRAARFACCPGRVDFTSPNNGGMLVARVMREAGVRFVFTLVGGHISPILVESERAGIRVVDVRHEATAAFAADAVARLTGVPGVCAVTAGPGLTNTVTAVKNAQMAESPLVLLGGAAATMLQGRGALQDIDQISLFRPLCKFTATVRTVKDIVPTLREAFRMAQEGTPGPVFVEFPIDTLYPVDAVLQAYGIPMPAAAAAAIAERQKKEGGKDERKKTEGGKDDVEEKTTDEKKAKKKKKKKGGIVSMVTGMYLNHHVRRLFSGAWDHTDCSPLPYSVQRATESQVEAAVRMLLEARRPVVLVGSQATLCTKPPARPDHLRAALEHMGIPCFLGGMARGLLGRDGALHIRQKRTLALKEADVVVMAGIVADFRLDYGRVLSRRSKIIAVNRSVEHLTRNTDMFWKPALTVNGDPGNFVARVSAKFDPAASQMEGGWLAHLRGRNDAREAEIEASAERKTDRYMNPLRVLQHAERSLPDNTILVADGGDFVGSAAYIMRPRGPLRWLDPGAFGTLGVGGGFALGAKLVHPDAQVVIVYGDGSLGYSVAEFDTFVRHKLPVLAITGNDACWTQIARDQVPRFNSHVACNLAFTDYHVVADGYGGRGFLVDKEADLAKAFKDAAAAIRAGKPALLNCLIGKTDFREGSISV